MNGRMTKANEWEWDGKIVYGWEWDGKIVYGWKDGKSCMDG